MKLPEILLIDKPAGMTSFDVIRRLRKQTGVRKFGHAGTLDPAASGLMIIGVEGGTKRLTEYTKLDKEYEAEILLGRSTTTADRDGELLEEADVPEISRREISGHLAAMIGTQRLPVSAYSAIKRAGQPMYKLARKAAKIGELVKDVPWRDMVICEAELIDIKRIVINHNTGCGRPRNQLAEQPRAPIEAILVQVRFKVGSGTYIRSLAEELGRRLGYPASLWSLRRTKIGKFDIKDAQLLENL